MGAKPMATSGWRKSSHSGSHIYSNCVELALVPASDNELSEAERDMLAVAKAVGVSR